MTKTDIIITAEKTFSTFTNYCSNITENVFFAKPTSKWSVAENIQHLIISTNMATLAYSLPKFIVRWVVGRPNRPSRTYEAVVAKYKKKLQEGGVAPTRFVPKPIKITIKKEKLLSNFTKATNKQLAYLQKNSDNDLDNYLVRHPLLGRITLRELGYFTIYHTQHHLNIIATITGMPL